MAASYRKWPKLLGGSHLVIISSRRRLTRPTCSKGLGELIFSRMPKDQNGTATSGCVEHAFLESGDIVLGDTSSVDKLVYLSMALQKTKDQPYREDSYVVQPKFQTGDEVVVLSQFHYFAKITKIDLDWYCEDFQKAVPLYKLMYRDWTAYEPGREWVAEYDLIALEGPLYRPLELWLAHRYNVQKKWSMLPKERKNGIFRLEKDDYAQITKAVDEQFRTSFLVDDPQVSLRKFLGLR